MWNPTRFLQGGLPNYWIRAGPPRSQIHTTQNCHGHRWPRIRARGSARDPARARATSDVRARSRARGREARANSRTHARGRARPRAHGRSGGGRAAGGRAADGRGRLGILTDFCLGVVGRARSVVCGGMICFWGLSAEHGLWYPKHVSIRQRIFENLHVHFRI